MNFDFTYDMAGIKLNVEGTFRESGRDAVSNIMEYEIDELAVYGPSGSDDISDELEGLFLPIPKSPLRCAQSVLDDIMEQALERRNE